MSPKKTLEEQMDSADKTIASKTFDGNFLIKIRDAIPIAIVLATFYFAITTRLSKLEENYARDRWSGTMQERWQTEFNEINGYTFKTVDVRIIQEKLKNQ